MLGIIGKKLGMSQVFEQNGDLIPVSIVEAGPCQIVQVKTLEKDGYSAVQLGFQTKTAKHVNKPEAGHFKAAKSEPYRFLTEIRDFESDYAKVGEMITVSLFNVGQRVKVSGVTKGKGFQGVVRRHGFKGGPKTHGQSDRLRAPGSIGASAYPSRVIKGMKMGGRMGGDNHTVNRLTIIKIDHENNLLYIKGAIPGARNGLVTIRRQER